MTTFTPLFLDQFRLMTHQSFNKKNGIWHPQEYSKAHTISLEAYSNGRVPRAFFSKCYTPSEAVAPFTFVLKKGLSPSDAIYSIGNKKPAILSSGCAYMLVFYRALCSYLGKEKFNALYGHDRFILCAHPFDTLTKFFFETVSIQSSAEIQLGDQCCFKNLLAYFFKHGLHENTYFVCNSDNTFMGLGFQGSTKSEVEESLFRQYNEPSCIKGSLSRHTISYEEFIHKQTNPPFPNEERLVLEVLRLQTARIEQMANTPIEELADLLENWGHPLKRHRPESPTI